MARERSGERWVEADVESCLAVIHDVERYPDFIRGYRSVEIERRDRRRRPAVVRFAVGGLGMAAAYRLSYSYSDDPATVAFTQLDGDLTRAIDGRYVLVPRDGGTVMRFEAHVEPAFKAPGLIVRKVEQIVLGSAVGALAAEVERRRREAVAGATP